jgi:hypothetical protein
MNFSILSYLLSTERYHQRAAREKGFSVPVMLEREVPPTTSPLLVSNSRGGFSTTSRSSKGLARLGFSYVPLENESKFFLNLFISLREITVRYNWENQFKTVSDSLSYMRRSPFQPKRLVVSEDLVSSFSRTPDDVSVGELDGVQVLSTTLPPGSALLVTDPVSFGVYVRVGDYLGVQLFNLREAVSLVV